MVKKTVAEKIAQAIKEKGLTQQQFCKKYGLGESVVSRWLKGNRNPSIKSLKVIANATGLPLNYFLDDSQKNFENSGIIDDRNTNNNFNADLKDIKIQLQDHEIRLLKLENELLKKKIGE
ncbi:MAG: helix-turn-helix transcriptional regulator [Elusimicrobia bacterium]|nr:helix-turn-helix transcriptional regulator [Elusimicrobiota bacterium]